LNKERYKEEYEEGSDLLWPSNKEDKITRQLYKDLTNLSKNINYSKKKKLIPLALGIFAPLTLTTPRVNASAFGAEIFCTMRDGGNDHESSWDAAYTYIKKQKGGFFKVSPKNAAAQITETVIREREKFKYCVEYLDNLHPNRKLERELQKEEKRKEKEAKEKENKRKQLEKELEETNKELSDELSDEFSDETLDRYSY